MLALQADTAFKTKRKLGCWASAGIDQPFPSENTALLVIVVEITKKKMCSLKKAQPSEWACLYSQFSIATEVQKYVDYYCS